MSQGRVVVVGAGVVGAMSALELSRAGYEVTVVDRGEFGSGCSHANCGYVCPSHVLPLGTPEAFRSSLKAMLSKNSPLKIRPRLDAALWGFLIRFARRCNTRDMLAAARAIRPLLTSSRELYPKLLEEERIDCEWQKEGLLFVFKNAPAFAHYAHTDELLTTQFATPATRYAGEALTALEPALKPGLAGGYHYEGDAHLRPDRLMSGLREVLVRRGVEFVGGCELTGFVRSGSSATAVVTSKGEWKADAFVLATGAWTPQVADRLGCRVPIQPGKGYSITMARPGRAPKIPLIFEEDRVAVTPFRSGYRIGSTMEFGGYDTSLNPARIQLLRDGARPYLHEPEGGPITEEWYGFRPMTPDSLPMIGATPAMGNVWLAAGHNMLGLSMAPATGKLVAELISGSTPHIDPAPYSAKRFG